ncbi:MAG: hypothetical protein IKL41_05390, partial [Clostridia bacterium]|nr:hypothetical protein [Clostridia bacterium]
DIVAKKSFTFSASFGAKGAEIFPAKGKAKTAAIATKIEEITLNILTNIKITQLNNIWFNYTIFIYKVNEF